MGALCGTPTILNLYNYILLEYKNAEIARLKHYISSEVYIYILKYTRVSLNSAAVHVVATDMRVLHRHSERLGGRLWRAHVRARDHLCGVQ